MPDRVAIVALSLLLASCANGPRPAPPSPLLPSVRTIAVRYVDAPDAISIRTDEIAVGSAIVSTVIFGVVLGAAAAVSDDMKAMDAAEVQARKLLIDNREALERFGFAARAGADVRAELERYGWASVAEDVAPIDAAADPVEVLRASGADAVIIVRPRLRLEERARFVRLWLEVESYEHDPAGGLRHIRSTDEFGDVDRYGVDGKKSPPRTEDGQLLKFGGMWLADDAARLRAEYAALAAERVPRSLRRLRSWNSDGWAERPGT